MEKRVSLIDEKDVLFLPKILVSLIDEYVAEVFIRYFQSVEAWMKNEEVFSYAVLCRSENIKELYGSKPFLILDSFPLTLIVQENNFDVLIHQDNAGNVAKTLKESQWLNWTACTHLYRRSPIKRPFRRFGFTNQQWQELKLILWEFILN